MNKKNILTAIIAGLIFNSTGVVADNFVFRSEMNGIKQSSNSSLSGGGNGGGGGLIDPEEPEEPEEELVTWEDFANERGLSQDWAQLSWTSENLTELPTAPYPVTEINSINLSGNPISTLTGLDNITKANYVMLGQTNLEDLEGLGGLSEVITFSLPETITSFKGLNSLTDFDNLYVYYLPNLVSLEGLENVQTMSTNTSIQYSGIVNLSGFDNLNYAQHVNIQNNEDLVSINAMNSLENVNNSIFISSNANLKTVNGFNNLVSVGNGVGISFSSALETISGFDKIETITNTLNMSNNPSLTEVNGFNMLTSVGGDVDLRGNSSLQNIDFLENVVVGNGVRVDSAYTGDKLSSDSVFCLSNDNFLSGDKSLVCEG